MDPIHDGPEWIDLKVLQATRITHDTMHLVLGGSAEPLPGWGPGAHIAIDCRVAGVRYYSLTGPAGRPDRYELGVKLSATSSGGSRWLFETATEGQSLRVSRPRNHFPLEQSERGYLFLSGGIGLTPVLAMLFALRARGIRAKAIHLCRTEQDLAFGEWLEDLATFHDLQVHVDQRDGGLYDVDAAVSAAAAGELVYCCGPTPMMQAVRSAGARLGRLADMRFEYFAPASTSACTDVGMEPGAADFVIRHHATGKSVPVAATQTMLAALRAAGFEMKSECEYGVCGWCAVKVVDGTPKHFDSYLTETERSQNKLVLPCVSRCESATITLDF